MELLAPVNADTLQAALDAGADAVYFGLTRLNARRGAKNFSPEELPEIVTRIHSAGAKAHLTLNIDLATRETGLAARTLQLAQTAGVDAVIVRDAALLALKPHFPGLEFHLSTQAGVSSSAGVKMAKEMGCKRAVLAREMTREEIRQASALPGVETEVFVQGAMCFCCSGRCLLSSWVGGRSGNRGTCASPCRVAWKSAAASAENHPLSMQDLCLVDYLNDLREMGVASLKIEGRLKSANWVSRAVTLYRKALDAALPPSQLRDEATALGNYTGRNLSPAYFVSQFQNLTENAAGRTSTAPLRAPDCQGPTQPTTETDETGLIIQVRQDDQRGTCFNFTLANDKATFRLPWQRVANPKRAITLATLLDEVITTLPRNTAYTLHCPKELEAILCPRRCTAQVSTALQEFLHRATKENDGQVRVTLPPAVATELETASQGSRHNVRPLNATPDYIRLSEKQINHIQHLDNKQVIFIINRHCHSTPIAQFAAKLPENLSHPPILSLPQVIYEEEINSWKEDILFCKNQNWLVEINSWDTLQLAKEVSTRFIAGPGLAVLNPLAARFLQRLGAEECHVSPEIDEEKFAALCASCEVPLTATVFARPPLMTTRAELPLEIAPGDNNPGPAFEDSRGVQLRAFREGNLTVLRPTLPYDWRKCNLPEIRVAHLCLDLCGSPNPLEDLRPAAKPFFFNLDRTLK